MKSGQSVAIILVGIICLGIGLSVGYVLYSGKTTTTRIVQTATSTVTQATTVDEQTNVTQTSIITTTETTISVETQKITVTPYCCTDPNLTISTACNNWDNPNSSSVLRLEYLIETDPDYISAENGSIYGPLYPLSCGFIYTPSTGNNSQIQYQSAYAIDRLYTDDCGYVENFTYFLTVTVPLTETGYNMSAIHISSSDISETTISCSSVITTTENTTNTRST